jgi:hypothetical protein
MIVKGTIDRAACDLKMAQEAENDIEYDCQNKKRCVSIERTTE